MVTIIEIYSVKPACGQADPGRDRGGAPRARAQGAGSLRARLVTLGQPAGMPCHLRAGRAHRPCLLGTRRQRAGTPRRRNHARTACTVPFAFRMDPQQTIVVCGTCPGRRIIRSCANGTQRPWPQVGHTPALRWEDQRWGEGSLNCVGVRPGGCAPAALDSRKAAGFTLYMVTIIEIYSVKPACGDPGLAVDNSAT